jgi:hypothetical protein
MTTTHKGTQMDETIFKNAFEHWITPEINRRLKANTHPEKFVLRAAQVVMKINEPINVRLNDEVKAAAQIRYARPVNSGDPIFEQDIQSIEEVSLTEDDANASHMTMLRIKGIWYISFDFRYNAEIINDHIDLAGQFLATATYARSNSYTGPFFDNLFSAVELTAKAWLLQMPLPESLKSKQHGFFQSNYNRHAKLGNVSSDNASLYNELRKLRESARYLNEPVNLTDLEHETFLNRTKKMLEETVKKVPKRMPKIQRPPTKHHG